MNMIGSALLSLAASAAIAVPTTTTGGFFDPPPVDYDNGNPAITRTVDIVNVSPGQPDYSREPLTSCTVRGQAASCGLKGETTLTNSLEWRGGVSTAQVEAGLGYTVARTVSVSATCTGSLKEGQTYYIYPTVTFYTYRVHSTAPPVVDYVNGNGWAPVDMRSDLIVDSVYDGGVACTTLRAN